MAYLGKDYKFESEDNYEAFLNAIGIPAEHIGKLLEFKPSYKLEKDGDTYTFTSTIPQRIKEIKFKSGVQLEETFLGILPIKTTFTVDGDTVTQVIVSDKGSGTFKREYNGDTMKVTMTSDKWDGVAYRYYKA